MQLYKFYATRKDQREQKADYEQGEKTRKELIEVTKAQTKAMTLIAEKLDNVFTEIKDQKPLHHDNNRRLVEIGAEGVIVDRVLTMIEELITKEKEPI